METMFCLVTSFILAIGLRIYLKGKNKLTDHTYGDLVFNGDWKKSLTVRTKTLDIISRLWHGLWHGEWTRLGKVKQLVDGIVLIPETSKNAEWVLLRLPSFDSSL
jgi:hypothetical protein